MNRTLTLLTASLFVAACGDDAGAPPPAPLVVEDLAAEVDPMIGTAGSGNVIPGALVPFGMVRVSPAGVGEHGRVAAYRYGDTELRGFTHTHLEGPGGSANGYNELLVTPFTATPDDDLVATHVSAFDHGSERAEPGYYAVTLADSGVEVELTATGHAAVHRYSYPAGARGRVLVDLGVAMGKAKDGHIEQVDAHTLRGWASYDEHPALSFVLQGSPTAQATLYFALTLDRDADEVGFFRRGYIKEADGELDGAGVGAWLGFDPGDAPVTVRVGVSFIDMEQARANLDAEVGERSFDDVRAAARAAWNAALSRVKVRGGAASERRIFYTALYHSLFQPADYTEVGGRFHSATDGTDHVHDGAGRHFYSDDWCMWDTYRTVHPLGTLVAPERRGDIVWSMLHAYTEGGWLPKCTWHASGYSRVMTGNPAVAIIADAYVKGLRDFDDALAWEAVDKAGMHDIDNIAQDQLCGYLNLGTVPDYRDLGYVPAACDPDQSASMTLEYAYDDWAAARFAEARGDMAATARYDARAENWRNQWNPEAGFMQARDADGSWVEPFDPDGYADYFVESTARIFSFFVPHDVAGMVAVMGGPEAVTARLDGFFDGGYLDISNEPSFHIPWLYDRTGHPEKTRARVREILATDFADDPHGLPGNDDSGATSAWYVLAALGLYPMAPGDGVWDLTVPRFEETELWIASQDDPTVGHTVVIAAPRPESGDETLRGVLLDDAPLDGTRVDHAALIGARRLLFELGAE